VSGIEAEYNVVPETEPMLMVVVEDLLLDVA